MSFPSLCVCVRVCVFSLCVYAVGVQHLGSEYLVPHLATAEPLVPHLAIGALDPHLAIEILAHHLGLHCSKTLLLNPWDMLRIMADITQLNPITITITIMAIQVRVIIII